MCIKYYFTEHQFQTFWTNIDFGLIQFASDRIAYWQTNLQPKFNIEYYESQTWGAPEQYGVLIGEEKHITWFLLQL